MLHLRKLLGWNRWLEEGNPGRLPGRGDFPKMWIETWIGEEDGVSGNAFWVNSSQVFRGEFVSKDRGVSPTGTSACLSWDKAEQLRVHTGSLSMVRKCQALPLPALPAPGHQPWGESLHISRTVEMLQQGSDVKLRLFSTRWPDWVPVRTWHENLGKWGLMPLPRGP